jgi:NTE family protein
MIKFGLALGGGGARGLAHIGVLKVLEREGINIFAITGCSMGAVIGALYAHYHSAQAVEEKLLHIIEDTDLEKYGLHALDEENKHKKKYHFESLFDTINISFHALMALKSRSYFNEEKTEEIFSAFPDVPIEKLKVKFSAIATDLISGEEVNLTKGSLRKAIRASSAIPGIFPPVKIDNMLLVDGAASESVPVRKVKEIGADRVLAVNVSRCLKRKEPPRNLLEILYRSQDITSFHLSQERLQEADLIIKPAVGELNWTDFEKIKEIIKAGEIAAEESLEEVKKLYKQSLFITGIKNKLRKILK